MRVFRNLWRLQQGVTLLEPLVAVVTGLLAMTVIGGPEDDYPDDQPQVTIAQDVYLRNVS